MTAAGVTRSVTKYVINTISVKISSFSAGYITGSGFGMVSYKSGIDPLGAINEKIDSITSVDE